MPYQHYERRAHLSEASLYEAEAGHDGVSNENERNAQRTENLPAVDNRLEIKDRIKI